ncbi:MAG: LLM class flavin-dependent oxidoreductase, partial [Acetobacteraceae bacterium]
QQRYVNVWPRPIQRPHPPIWIPGGGSVETWQWCAEMDYVYSYLSYYGYKMGKSTMDGFWAEMDRLGKDRNPYRAGFAQTVAVAESRQQAIDLYTDAAEYFFGRCLHIDPRFATPPGYTTEATIRMGMQSQVGRAAAAAVQRPTRMEDLIAAGYLVIGTPEEVVDQLHELATTLNVGHLMLLLQFGNMDKALTKYNTKLYAERVMPKLRPLFAAWEDRWWPRPMDAADRAPLPAFTPRRRAPTLDAVE